MIGITRYTIKNQQLSPWVKCIWLVKNEHADYHYKLLPTDCIDVILNLESCMVYETASKKIIAPSFHINGLRSKNSFIHHENNVCTYGISFYPYGLVPFVHRPIDGLRDEILHLRELSLDLEQKLSRIVFDNQTHYVVDAIEQALVSELSLNRSLKGRAELIQDFLTFSNDMPVKDFCKERSVNVKTFERMFVSFTGFTPKLLRNIKRFQQASNQIVHERACGIAEIAYDNHFSDQTHFTKDFRRFAGVTPRSFQLEKNTVKENAVYTFPR